MKVGELDAPIRATFPSGDILDFNSNVLPADYFSDGLHLNGSGQFKRASVVYKHLFPNTR